MTPPRGDATTALGRPQRQATRIRYVTLSRWSPCAGQVAQIVRLTEQALKEGGLGIGLVQGTHLEAATRDARDT